MLLALGWNRIRIVRKAGSGDQKKWTGSGHKKWAGSGDQKKWTGSGHKKWAGSGDQKKWTGSGNKKNGPDLVIKNGTDPIITKWAGSGHKKLDRIRSPKN
jgi:hypothetical protein